MIKKNVRPSWKYSYGKAYNALRFTVLALVIFTFGFSLSTLVMNYKITATGAQILILVFAVLLLFFLFSVTWVLCARCCSKVKTGLLGNVIRYDHMDKETKEIYTNYRIHLDNFWGLYRLRRMARGVKELRFALEFLLTLQAIKQGVKKDWPCPRYINATSFKLKKDSRLIKSLGLPIQEIRPGFKNFSDAFLSAFVECPNLRGFIKIKENLSLPLYKFSITFDDLIDMDIDSEIERLEKAIARRENRSISSEETNYLKNAAE